MSAIVTAPTDPASRRTLDGFTSEIVPRPERGRHCC
jgi:hypothetical protein